MALRRRNLPPDTTRPPTKSQRNDADAQKTILVNQSVSHRTQCIAHVAGRYLSLSLTLVFYNYVQLSVLYLWRDCDVMLNTFFAFT